MDPSIRNVELFAELSDADLNELADGCEMRELGPGDMLFDEGDDGDEAFVICGGEIEIVKGSAGREVLLAVRKEGEVIGEMALLEQSPRMAGARARSQSRLLVIPKPRFDHLLETSTSALHALFHTILGRLRGTEAQLRQAEKMAQLGTLTAGVAHELNNPAAAVKRAADQLRDAIGDYGAAQKRLAAVDFGPSAEDVSSLLADADAASVTGVELDPLDRSDREGEIEVWLDEHGVENAWEWTPDLVEAGVDAGRLAELGIDDDDLHPVVSALVTGRRVQGLLAQIEQGGSRLSEIVKALKSYSYLDQAPQQSVDVRQGIDDTLLILRSKLKDIRVQRHYADDLPEIEAYGSELNQVWTNLLDNAADALHEAEPDDPTVTIRAFTERDLVVVEVEDNGPGIPPDIVDRIFDSFFTTKPPGKGTGLGLDISYKIVVMKHRGDLTVDSEPGRTTFRIELPITSS